MAVSITQTASPNPVAASSNVATYTNVAIGDADPSRIVVVLVASELASSTASGCTLGGSAMTAGTGGASSPMYAQCYYLAYPTGTTATIAVTFSATNPTDQQNKIAVYSVLGGKYSAKGGTQGTDYRDTALTTGNVTIATNGGMIAVTGGEDAGSNTWSNLTVDINADVGSFHFTTAKSITPGTAARTCTGATNNEVGAMSWLVFTEGDLSVSTTETCTVGEAITINESILNVNPAADVCTVGEAISIYEKVYNVAPSADVSTVGEAISIYEKVYNISTSDTCTAGEVSTVVEPYENIIVSDTSTLTDAITPEQLTYPTIITSDTCTVWDIPQYPDNLIWISEVVTVTISDAFLPPNEPAVSDTSTLADAVTVVEPVVYPSVSDTSTLADSVTVLEPILYQAVSDTSTLADSILINQTPNLNISDTSTLTDIPTALEPKLYIGADGWNEIEEVCTVRGAVTIYITKLFPSVSDTCTLSDSVTVLEPTEYPVVSDTSTLEDSITLYVSLFNVIASDTSTLEDSITIYENLFNISVSDTSTLTDGVTDVNEQEISYINVSDTVTAGEVIESVGGSCVAEVIDVTTVQDAVDYNISPLFIEVSDTCTALDLWFIPPSEISVSDTCTLADSIGIEKYPFNIQITDTCTCREHFHTCIKRWFIRPPLVGGFSKHPPTAGVWVEVNPTSSSWSKKTPTSSSWSKKTPTATTWDTDIQCEC